MKPGYRKVFWKATWQRGVLVDLFWQILSDESYACSFEDYD